MIMANKSEALVSDYNLLDSRPIIARKNYGSWIMGSIVVLLAALLVNASTGAKIDFSVTGEYLTQDFIIQGAINTLTISILSMILGVVLGLLSSLARLSSNPVIRFVAIAYVWAFRGTPVLVQLLLWYNLALIFPTLQIPFMGSVSTNAVMTPFVAALIGLGINEGAYMSEIFRGGILSVGAGQREAAKALGMKPFTVMRKVVLPQAFRVSLPGTGNQFVIMLKSSSLASVVQYSELLHSAQTVYQRNLSIIELLLVASIWYIALTTIFTVLQSLLERRLGKSQARSTMSRRTPAKSRSTKGATR